MEFFLHPWYMVAGGALVSSPILIHLINRMRFKRLRWAAMEFLLKSQKRNRRRLIIEQLILLLLRILLVLLAAFLVARFVGGLLADTDSGSTHVIVIDDTLSMTDRWEKKGEPWNAFAEAGEQVRLLARTAGQAASPQRLAVFLLSDLHTPLLPMQPINSQTLETLTAKLKEVKPSLLHVDPLEAFTKAKQVFDGIPNGQKLFHFVSDFRDSDWKTGPNRDKLQASLTDLVDNRVHVSFVDVADPYRGKTGPAQQHDNLAIESIKAETRVAAAGVPIRFTITIRNYGVQAKSKFLKVFVDNIEDYQATSTVTVPAGGSIEKTINLTFDQTKEVPKIEETDPPEERERKRRLEREFKHIRAQIEPEAKGVNADNVRDLVMEVRGKVPMLIVDGTGPEGREEGGDLHHLAAALYSVPACDVEICTPGDLMKRDLGLYPCIIFLNVAEIKDAATVKRLDDYATNGGSLAYYVGDKVKADWYNSVLFTKHKALFPVLLDRPYNPLDPSGLLDEQKMTAKRVEWLQKNQQPKIILRDKKHPVSAVLAGEEEKFRYVAIDRYFKAQDRSKWDPEPHQVKELMVLPNIRSMTSYKEGTQGLMRTAVDQTRTLAAADPKFARYIPVMEAFQRQVRDALATDYLYNLSRALETLLNDPGDPKDPSHPNMPNLWAEPQMKGLAAQIRELHEDVSYGDPLVVARKHGKGQVVAILTAAGTASKWNDWASGPVGWSFVAFVLNLQNYLTREGDDLSRNVGEGLAFDLDVAKYDAAVKGKFLPQPDLEPGEKKDAGKGGAAPAAAAPAPVALTMTMPTKDKRLLFDLPPVRQAGLYTFEFTPKGAAAGQTETRAYVFNVNSAQESDLKRVDSETLAGPAGPKDPRKGSVVMRVPGDNFEALKERPPDASESPWLYLLFLVVLIVEQALAVHLSFHLRGSEAAPAPAAPRTPAAAA